MSEAGISKISLYGNEPGSDASEQAQGNTIVATSNFIRDGQTSLVGDVRLNVNNHYTTYLGDTAVSTAASELPQLKGFGVLPDLRVALTRSGSLRSTLKTTLPTLNTTNLSTLRKRALPILNAWQLPDTSYVDAMGQPIGSPRSDVPIAIGFDESGARSVYDYAYQRPDGFWRLQSSQYLYDDDGNILENPTLEDVLSYTAAHFDSGQWEVISGEEIAFLERYFGQPLPLSGSASEEMPGSYSLGNFIENMYQRLELASIKLAVQGPLSSFFVDVAYDKELDKFVPTTDKQLVPTFEAILSAAPLNDATGYLSQWQDLLRSFIGIYDRQTDGAKNTYSFIAANLVAAYENLGGTSRFNLSFTETAEALSIPEGIVIESDDVLVNGTDTEDIFYIDSNKRSSPQTFSGGKLHDAYILGKDFGEVVINDLELALQGVAPDLLRFAHLKESDVTFTRKDLDLVITSNLNKNDRVTIKGQFSETYGSYYDDHGVAEITFSDGVYLDQLEIVRKTPQPSILNDVVIGTSGITAFDGGAGFDTFSDSGSNDYYVFGKGYSHDIINDTLSIVTNDLAAVNNVDYLKFKDGITPENLRFEQESGTDSLHVYIENSSDILTINNQFNFSSTVFFDDEGFEQVEVFTFENGQSLYMDEVLKKAQTALKSEANSLLEGTNSSDYLDGGAGNDLLQGKNYSDTYVFGKGYGFDRLVDWADVGTSTADTVLFAANVSPEDVVITAVSAEYSGYIDVLVSFKDDNSQLYLESQFSTSPIAPNLSYVESFQFQDEARTRWSWEDVRDRYKSAKGNLGYNDITGTDSDNVLSGTEGKDYFKGGSGSDTYEYTLGGGADIIDDQYGYDENIILFGDDITAENLSLSRGANSKDLHITFNNSRDSLTVVENFSLGVATKPDSIHALHFNDGSIWDSDVIRQKISGHTAFNDYIVGFQTDDILSGGKGDDYLDGNAGNDTYSFNIGDGHDVIDDSDIQLPDAEDKLVFGAGITPESVLLREHNGDLLIDIVGQDDWLTIRDQFRLDYNRSIERFVFKDGTQWVHQDVLDILSSENNNTPNAQNDTGFSQLTNTDLVIDASNLLNNDSDIDDHRLAILAVGESKNGRATLLGDGNVKFTPDDSFTGTAIFSYTVNDGHGGYSNAASVNINVKEKDISTGNNSGLRLVGGKENDVLNGGIGKDVLLGRAGDDELFGSSGDDRLLGGNGNDLLNGNSGSDRLVGSKGNDKLLGEDGDDRLLGGGGSDQLIGGTGLDRLRGGAGNDELAGGAGDDFLTGDAGNDIIDGETGNDSLTGGGGNDFLNGGAGNDLLKGGAGDDLLNGGAGNDTFILSSYTGVDTIKDFEIGVDSISLSSGLTFGDLSFRSVGEDLLVDVDGELSAKFFDISALDSNSFTTL